MTKLIVAVFLIACAPAPGQTSFDSYFAASKKLRSGARETAFLHTCRVNRQDAHITYGLSTARDELKFHRTPSLLSGRNEAETDFFGSAEVWTAGGKPRFVNVWTLVMDVGQESNEMFCLSDSGVVTSQESLNRVYGALGGGASWIHGQRLAFNVPGVKKVLHSGYLRADGSPASPPRLSRDEVLAAETASDVSLAYKVIAALSR